MASTRTEARRKRHFRVRKNVSGTADQPRLAVYRSNKYIYAQLIDDVSGNTLASASSQEKDFRGDALNVGTAEKVGKLLGERAKDGGISSAVFDRGGYKYHGKVKALADAAREAGLEF